MMATKVLIREHFDRFAKKNPVSGHKWTEYGPTTSYQVIGAVGVHSTHRTEKGAKKEAQALQEFYDKFDL